MTERRGAQPDRSFVLFAVMIVVMSALLVATSLLFMAQADLAAQAGSAGRTQSRLLAWSGVQAVMNRLDVQRERVLDGELPRIDEEYTLYETGDRRGVVRLLEATADGGVLAPEAAKLDLNAVTAEMLVDTGLVSEDQASAIISHRDGVLRGTYQTVAELLSVPGIVPEDVYGPIEELTVMDQALGRGGDLAERVAERLEDASPRGLADLVTVYGFEPALQRDGRLRINLNVPWSDELARRVEERFGEGASQGLKRVFDNGTRFATEAKIFEVLRLFNVEPADWPDIVDALTAEESEYLFGRLDINTASYEAISALPGLEPEQAAQIVRARDGLAIDDKATIAWPAIEGIVDPAAYDELAGRITTRSWTYRLRLAAGEIDVNAEAFADEADRLLDPVIYEAVIDLSAPRARVAYLREITFLQTAALLAMSMTAEDQDEYEYEDDVEEEDPGRDLPPPAADRRVDPVRESVEPEEGTPASSPPARRRVGRWQGGR